MSDSLDDVRALAENYRTHFVFEAFDEPWKGSADPLEPEKHWGLFTVERQPKLAVELGLMALDGKVEMFA